MGWICGCLQQLLVGMIIVAVVDRSKLDPCNCRLVRDPVGGYAYSWWCGLPGCQISWSVRNRVFPKKFLSSPKRSNNRLNSWTSIFSGVSTHCQEAHVLCFRPFVWNAPTRDIQDLPLSFLESGFNTWSLLWGVSLEHTSTFKWFGLVWLSGVVSN